MSALTGGGASARRGGSVCRICKRTKPRAELVPAALVRDSVVERIRRVDPDWSGEGFICRTDLNRFRNEYIQSLLESERGELSALEQEVLESLRQHELLSRNVESEFESRRSLGERLSDRLAAFGGSWTFLIFFALVMLVWILLNALWLSRRPFDPYPFVLLNLVLSCLAAVQAPIIMMSQNRQEAKDRVRALHDYQINMKAELEIRHLHEKVDHLLSSQWARLVEIQQVQLELMNELSQRR